MLLLLQLESSIIFADLSNRQDNDVCGDKS